MSNSAVMVNYDTKVAHSASGDFTDLTGITARTAGSRVYGITMNNENECNSNDSWIGFGCGHTSCGGLTWSPSNTIARKGWIFVR